MTKQITFDKLQTAYYITYFTNYKLQHAKCKLQRTNYKLEIHNTSCTLRIIEYT